MTTATNVTKWLSLMFFGAPIVFIHEFHKPPYGGGNQFLLALRAEFLRRGILVGHNRVGRRTRVILFNSFNFDFARVRKLKNKGIRMIHRVDGPISKYRGKDEEIDRDIHKLNNELANGTIFQSQYSLRMHREMGLEFRNPVVIPNACDPAVFFKSFDSLAPENGQKVRIITSSWSDNPRKGLETYKWLDSNLDFNRFDYTFVGRCQTEFKNIRKIAPVGSEALADMLRQHHIFLTASMNDACSNALIEALTCGLPAVYHDSGGSRELVGCGGCGFEDSLEIPMILKRMVADYDRYRSGIKVIGINEVAVRYHQCFEGR
jgi:glycosyltransferase involved in cell wall biosynthesis